MIAPRLLLTVSCALLLVAPAAGQLSDRKESIDARIAELNAKVAAARAREGELASEITSLTSRIQTLEREVGDVSARLESLEHDLALHREKLARLTALLKLQTERLRFLKQQHGVALERLNRRLIEIYQSEEPDTLDVVLEAASFTDVLEQLDYFRTIGSQDRRIADDVGAAKVRMRELREHTARTRARVATVTRTIAVRTEQVRALRDRLLVSQRGLVGVRGERRESLVVVQQSARKHAAEEAALSQVSAQLAARIQASQAVASQPVFSGASTDSTPSASGLIWPVSGPVVSGFGMRWGRMHEGIDIAAGSGTPIAAAASGTVIYAGWMGGYGNLVVIDHGGGLATAYAHQSSIAVGAGQAVSQGQVIGYVGCTGHCYGSHLHFEVRVNGVAVDPLGYL
jgi:murein DD-endopeptidase MepM/ murein hydrolase activator NlpD